MVAVASPVQAATEGRANGWAWTVGTGAVVIAGLLARLALGGGGVGDRSATLMVLLLTVCAFLAARVVSGPRVALLVTTACVVLFDLAGLPARNLAVYDDVQAFYRTDQVLEARVDVGEQGAVTLTAQAVFAGSRPAFGLGGEINGLQLRWDCAFQRGVQQVALPIPLGVTGPDVRLHLTGAPSRESDYLLVYQSSRRGGYLIDAGAPVSTATSCALV